MMMRSDLTRRMLLQSAGAGALAASAPLPAAAPQPGDDPAALPRICLELSGRLQAAGADEAGMRRVKQLGVDYVAMGGAALPWQESEIRARMERLKAGGLTLGNLMIGGFPNTIYGKPGRDEEIDKVRQSVRAAGKAGLAVVEYNFYAHRAMEGYYELPGRAGSGYTGFDYERMKGLAPLENEGAHKLDEMWN